MARRARPTLHDSNNSDSEKRKTTAALLMEEMIAAFAVPLLAHCELITIWFRFVFPLLVI
jgi:hypothetical protein